MEVVRRVVQRNDEAMLLRLLAKALDHYSNKITSLQKDHEMKNWTPLIDEDLANHSMTINKLSKDLQSVELSLETFLLKNEDMLRYALLCYMTDLDNARSLFWTKLGAKPRMENVNKEIQVAKELLNALGHY